jgi:uncharacterized repeat protein (TIGR02543 family)
VGATIGDLLTDDEYIFEGWFSDETCQTSFTGITVADEDPVTVYAKVTHNPVVQRNIVYTAIINGEESTIPAGMYISGGSYPNNYTQTQGVDIDPLQDLVEGGTAYFFKGWYLEKDCQTQVTGIPATQTGKTTVYAKIVKETARVFDINYFAIVNGEKAGIPQSMYDMDTSKYPSSYTVGFGASVGELISSEEYIFEGWFKDESCQTPFTGISATEGNAVTLYAKVSHNPVVQRNIVYKAVIGSEEVSIPAGMFVSGGNYPDNYTQTQGATIDALQDLEEGEYTYFFQGWYLEKACVTQITEISQAQTGKVTLYAKINKTTAQRIAINYFAIVNGEKTGIPQVMYDTDTTKYPSTYTVGFGATIGDLISNDEYIFEGWYQDETCQTPFVGISKTENQTVTVYAKITHIVEIVKKIYYQAVIGGKKAEFPYGYFDASKFPTEYVVGEGVAIADIISKHPDYEFKGWYLDEACTQALGGRIALQTEDVVLYAKIEKNMHSGNYT